MLKAENFHTLRYFLFLSSLFKHVNLSIFCLNYFGFFIEVSDV